jgi:AraC family transcriptional regulator
VSSGSDTPRFDEASRQCRHALPITVIASSEDADWTSVLVEVNRAHASEEPFETLPTPDQTIVVVTRGEQELQAFRDGAWRRATYRAGTVGLTPGGDVARLRRRVRASQSVEKVNVYMPQRFLLEAAEHYRRAGHRAAPPRLGALAFQDPLIAQTVSALVRGMRAGAADLYAESAMQWLAAHLLAEHASLRAISDDTRSSGSVPDSRMADVLEYMRVHLQEPLTLDHLAAQACVSKFHFARIFRTRTGVSPHAYLVELRMDAARHLLASADLSIAEVARRCGFRRPAHFATAFTKQLGLSPTAFRRESLGERPSAP